MRFIHKIAWLRQTSSGAALCRKEHTQWFCNAFVKRLARAHSSDTGPPTAKVRAIPFTQHVKAADKTFKDFHGKGFFTARMQHSGPPEEIFLPFWIVSARVQVKLVQAQVGRTSYRSHYNPSTKRNEVRQETVWAWVPEKHTWSRDYYPTEHVGLHVYASHKYRRGFVNKIRSGQSLREATKFTPDLLDRPSYPDLDAAYRNVDRKVDPYTMYTSTALRFAKAYMTSTEEYYADEMLRRVYSAYQTRFVQVELDLQDVHISPVYYPAFVYTVDYLGRKLRTFVNGHDLSVGGMHVYNWNHVAAVSALGMASIMAMTGGIGWGGLSGSFWIGVVLPTLATSMLAYYYPILSLRVRDAFRQREINQSARDPRSWDADWVRAYDAYEEQQRYRAWKTEKQERKRTHSATDHGTVGDPRGYYQTLGVRPDAAIADIQAAFRGLAMKYHPDRYSDPVEKKEATAKFQQISAAYSVLRDPKKRRAYDAGARM